MTKYVRSIKFTDGTDVYYIRDGETKARVDEIQPVVDGLSLVARTGEFKDLLNAPIQLPALPEELALTNDLYLKWNHELQMLEWVKISDEPEYDPTTQSLNVSNEVYDSSSNTLETPSVEPSED